MQNTKSIITAPLLVVLLSASGLFAQFAGGTGTESDPYQISTPEHLNNVRNYLGDDNSDKYFKLMNDIDLTVYLAEGGAGYAAWGAAGWLPIGDCSNQFTGLFDGDNHKILGLKIDREFTDDIGFFSIAGSVAILKNIGVEIATNGFIKGNRGVGGLVGFNHNGTTIRNCHVSGIVNGIEDVGGLIGKNYGISHIQNCYSTGVVVGTKTIGGLVGFNTIGATIDNSYAITNVSGNNTVGGLVGQNYQCVVSNSYATGTVSQLGNYGSAGGLVGANSGSTIINSYATGNVSGTDNVGGLAGGNDGSYGSAYIINSYATGVVSGTENVGGLVGINSSIINNCYTTGVVIGTENIGGLVGYNYGVYHLTTVSYCYATGAVNNTNYSSGGLVGYNYNGITTTSYWDKETTGQVHSAGSVDSLGKTTAEMKTQSTYNGWDFIGETINGTNDYWELNPNINNGYPHFANPYVGIKTTSTPIITKLLSNYPNPFNPSTTINFELQKSNNINLSIYNARGELIKTLLSGVQNAGEYSVTFDGTGLNSGVYFYKLEADGKAVIKRMLMLK